MSRPSYPGDVPGIMRMMARDALGPYGRTTLTAGQAFHLLTYVHELEARCGEREAADAAGPVDAGGVGGVLPAAGGGLVGEGGGGGRRPDGGGGVAGDDPVSGRPAAGGPEPRGP